MVVDALRAYVQLASGLTEVTLERAKTAAKALVTQAGSLSEAPAESAAQVRALADELMKTARDNRGVVVNMVRTEVERAVAAMGVVAVDDFTALQRRLADLEARFRGGAPTDTTVAADARPADDSTAGDRTEGESAPTSSPESESAPLPDDAVAAEPELSTDAGSPAQPDVAAGGAESEQGDVDSTEAKTATDAPAADRSVTGDAADSSSAGEEGESVDVFEEDSAATSDEVASDSTDGETSQSGSGSNFDIPTPIAVERVVAKKRAAEREWDEDGTGDSSDAGADSDETAQDPSPPDVSTA